MENFRLRSDVSLYKLYLQSMSPYLRKWGMEARDFSRVRLHNTVIGNKVESELVKDVSLNHIKHGGDDIWARAEQAIKFIENIQEKYPDKTVAIVTSDTLTQAIITRLAYGKVNGVIWSGQYYVPNCTCVAFKCEKGHIKEIEMPDHAVLSIKRSLKRNEYER